MNIYDESGVAHAPLGAPELEEHMAGALARVYRRQPDPIECAGTRFYAHVYGPDDMLPMPTWEKALEEANTLNAAFVKLRETATENDAVMYAIAEKVEG